MTSDVCVAGGSDYDVISENSSHNLLGGGGAQNGSSKWVSGSSSRIDSNGQKPSAGYFR
jgi:hypothetical protein